MTKTKVKIQLLNNKAKMPVCGSKYSAGYDLYSICDEVVTIGPHETLKMKTGVAMEIPEGYFGAVFARSGIATKRGLRPANCTGVVDSDYRGEIKVNLYLIPTAVLKADENGKVPKALTIKHGERFAQLVFAPVKHGKFQIVDEFSEDKFYNERCENGHGSTGSN